MTRYLVLWPLVIWALVIWAGARREQLPPDPWERPPALTQRQPRAAISGRGGQSVHRSANW